MRYRVAVSSLLLLFSLRQPLPAQEKKWFELSSEHFLLFTDAGEAKGRRLLTDFEVRIDAFSQVFGRVPARQFPIEVFLFKNDQDYTEVLPRPKGEEKLTKSAYLLRGPDRIFIVAKDKSSEDIANDVAHALGHVLFERYVFWHPFWLVEGAAEYLRKVERSPDSKAVSEADGFSAADIVTIAPSAAYDDDLPGGAFRTQSYRLLRILYEDSPEVLRRYLQTLRTEGDTLPTIEIDKETTDARLKSYVETPLKASPISPAIKSVDASLAKVAIHRGDLMLPTSREADAARWYNADSKDARAARAILTRFSRPAAEAVRALDRTAREIPDNGLVQYHFGAMEVQDKKDIQSQTAALERAVQLLPLMGRAHAELARVYTLNGQAEKALPLIARALELEPEFADRFYEIRANVRVSLAQLDQAFHDINIASALPHADKSAGEHYSLEVSAVRRKIELVRREIDDRRLEQIRSEVAEEVERREPPPKPTPPPPPVPTGRISYEIEARAPIEVLETVYPDYPEALRKSGTAGAIALRVDVGPDGKVKSAAIASSKLADLNAATLEAVKKWSFRPGNRSIRVIVTYSLQ